MEILTTMLRTALDVAGLSLFVSCATAASVSPAVRADIAPTGTLRAGINIGNPLVATKDPVSGAFSGVGVDLVREIGRRLDVPIELIGFDVAARIADAVRAGTLDVGTLAYDPGRDNVMSFTSGYVRVEATYVV